MSSISQTNPEEVNCLYADKLDHRGAVSIRGAMLTGGLAHLLVILGVITWFRYMSPYFCAVLFTIGLLEGIPFVIRIVYQKTLPESILTSELHKRARRYMLLSFIYLFVAFVSSITLAVLLYTSPAFYCDELARVAFIFQALNIMRHVVTIITIYVNVKAKKKHITGWE